MQFFTTIFFMLNRVLVEAVRAPARAGAAMSIASPATASQKRRISVRHRLCNTAFYQRLTKNISNKLCFCSKNVAEGISTAMAIPLKMFRLNATLLEKYARFRYI
jgi:hypothetical protein